MNKIILLFLLFSISFLSVARKKERLFYEVGYTVTAFSPDKKINLNTIYLDEAQDILDSLFPNVYVNLMFELKSSNLFHINSEKYCIFVEKKKLITVKNGEKKFKRIKEKEKEIFYNLY